MEIPNFKPTNEMSYDELCAEVINLRIELIELKKFNEEMLNYSEALMNALELMTSYHIEKIS